MTSIPREIFRAYDIRGIYQQGEQGINPENFYLISRAVGTAAKQKGIDCLLVGYDGRLSSPALLEALLKGLRDSGCDTVNLGLVPTPLLYFACHELNCDSGVMLTASHNPANYNGLKIVFNNSPLSQDQISRLYDIAVARDFVDGQGLMKTADIAAAYVERIAGDVKVNTAMKVVVDCGNAVPGTIAPTLFHAMGCEVIPLFCEVDGSFPNHHPDPTVPVNLQALCAKVVEQGADLGIAFDGDGDRVGLVSNTGETVDTDELLMLLAQQILPLYKGSKAVFDVKCSNRLHTLCRQYEVTPVMSRSGHSFMKQKMRETNAAFGGEYAAHIFIKDRWYGFDDGIYAAARVLEILSQAPSSLDDLLKQLPESYSSAEIKIPVDEACKFVMMDKILERASFPGAHRNTTDGLRVEYPDRWGLIRASNTSPALLLRFEANSSEALHTIQSEFRALILETDKDLLQDFF